MNAENGKSARRFAFRDVAPLLSGTWSARGPIEAASFTNLKTPREANRDSIVFIVSERADCRELAKETRAAIVICDPRLDIEDEWLNEKCFLVVENPRLTMLRIGNQLFGQERAAGIHPSAVIHPEARIAPTAHVGPLVHIGKAVVGEGAVILGNNHLYDGVQVGPKVIIHAGAVVGADGWGHILNEQAQLENFPHVGGVVLGEGVELGPNACVARGALGDTVIGKNSKIDALTQIGHNVRIEENVLVLAGSVVCGSAVVGADAVLGVGARVMDYVRVGRKAHVGAGALVFSDVPDYGKVVAKPAQLLPVDYWNKPAEGDR